MPMETEGRGIFKEKKSIAAERSSKMTGEWSPDLVMTVVKTRAQRVMFFLSF